MLRSGSGVQKCATVSGSSAFSPYRHFSGQRAVAAPVQPALDKDHRDEDEPDKDDYGLVYPLRGMPERGAQQPCHVRGGKERRRVAKEGRQHILGHVHWSEKHKDWIDNLGEDTRDLAAAAVEPNHCPHPSQREPPEHERRNEESWFTIRNRKASMEMVRRIRDEGTHKSNAFRLSPKMNESFEMGREA